MWRSPLIIYIFKEVIMIDYPKYVKGKLTEIISKMTAEPKLFVKNPNANFTRKRKLSFETVMNLMLSMGGNSLTSELMEYFDYDVDMASSSIDRKSYIPCE